MRDRSAFLVSVNAGLPATYGGKGSSDPLAQPWTTAIFKLPVRGQVRITRSGLEGDGQAGPRPRAGDDMAVLGYASSHYPAWRIELGRPELEPGAFGENFTIAGQTERSVCIGDIYAVGETLLQVSLPRRPCWRLQRRLAAPGIIQEVHRTQRGGWYFRVMQEGRLGRGDEVRLRERPHPGWSVACAYRIYARRDEDPDAARMLAAVKALAAVWKEKLLGSAEAARKRRGHVSR